MNGGDAREGRASIVRKGRRCHTGGGGRGRDRVSCDNLSWEGVHCPGCSRSRRDAGAKKVVSLSDRGGSNRLELKRNGARGLDSRYAARIAKGRQSRSRLPPGDAFRPVPRVGRIKRKGLWAEKIKEPAWGLSFYYPCVSLLE